MDDERVYETDHEYVSTACQHKLHEACRKFCKFCSRRCDCSCHAFQWGGDDVSS